MGPTTNTDPEHWRRVDALLSEALALPAAQRESWLVALPDKDRALVPMLRKMLARAARPTDGFMDRPVSATVFSAQGVEVDLERPGAEIGLYRLIRELGTGGMGRVWLAERTDGQLQRQVALKLPRMGWARGVAERLTQERDALASLEHPNIARLYDAGTANGGRPYIAMEYVEGVPISDYVLSRSSDLRERLKLFLQVAGAVAFAHSHLIVHRDIKPQNILVTADGVAHLLDFGAAKLLGRDDEAFLTRQVGGAMSPDYAAPEQIRGDRITVATDVYSLGILLYEMLTGARPYRLQRLSGAALEQAILKADIPLSSSVATLDRSYARQLRGDIDAIIAKATRRNPAHRYGSVQAFADDLQRHLAGEPVLAQRQTGIYRAWKFARRNRMAVGAASAVALALGVGAIVSLWQANVARQEAARAQRVKDFVTSIFSQAVPKTGIGGTVTALDLLDVGAERLNSELADDPAVAAELGIILADSYTKLGYDDRLEPLLRKTVERAERAFGPNGATTLDAQGMLAYATMLSDPAGSLERIDKIRPYVEQGLPKSAQKTVVLMRYRAFVLAKLNRRDESYASLREAIAIAEKHLGIDDSDTILLYGSLSNTYGRFRDRKLQLEAATEGLARATRKFGPLRPHVELIAMERWYADALRENDRPGDAVPILRRVLADQRRLDSAETLRVRNAMLQLGTALLRVGEVGEGLELTRRAYELELQQNATDTDDRRGFADFLATALAVAMRVDEALAQSQMVEEIAARVGNEMSSNQIGRKLRQARLLAFSDRMTEALPLISEAETMAAKEQDPELWFDARLVRALAHRLADERAAAAAVLENLMSDPRYSQRRLAQRSGVEAELGLVRLEQNRLDEAAAALQRCERLFVQAQIRPSIRVSGCLLGIGMLKIQQGRLDEALERLEPLVSSIESVNAGSPWHGQALYWLARAQQAKGDSRAAGNLQRARRMLAGAKAPILRRLLTE